MYNLIDIHTLLLDFWKILLQMKTMFVDYLLAMFNVVWIKFFQHTLMI